MYLSTDFRRYLFKRELYYALNDLLRLCPLTFLTIVYCQSLRSVIYVWCTRYRHRNRIPLQKRGAWLSPLYSSQYHWTHKNKSQVAADKQHFWMLSWAPLARVLPGYNPQKFFETIEWLQEKLDLLFHCYNNKRIHQGNICSSRMSHVNFVRKEQNSSGEKWN